MLLAFNVQVLWPLAIILIISTMVPVLLSVFKLKFIPSLVVEIISGVVLALIPEVRELFVVEETLTPFNEGLYVIGMSVLLFLSGLDTDFSVFKVTKKHGKDTFPVLLYSIVAFLVVIILSLGCAFIFYRQISGNKVAGIALITIFLSSTFASLVIPLVHDADLEKYTIGKVIATYSTIAELTSIIGLSIVMEFLAIIEHRTIWGLIVIAVVFLLIFLVRKFVDTKKLFGKKLEGIVNLTTRITLCVLLLSVLLSDLAGMEYILGAFLSGMLIKALFHSHKVEEKMGTIGYGLFVPIFYIFVGFKVGLLMEEVGLREFFTLETLGLFVTVWAVMLLTKAPILYLCKYYFPRTTIPTLFITTSTIIVSITIEHLSKEEGIFNDTFLAIIIFASLLTCIIPPILFANNSKFDEPRPEKDDFIVNKSDFESEIKEEHE